MGNAASAPGDTPTPEPENFKAQVRESLALNGLRSNANSVASPTRKRKRSLTLKPKLPAGFNSFIHAQLPEQPALIRQNGSLSAAKMSARYAVPAHADGFLDWIRRQRAFMNGLSYRDKIILRSYTMNGDELVNNFLRGTLDDNAVGLKHMIANANHTFDLTGTSPLAFLGFYLYEQYDAFAGKIALPPRATLIEEKVTDLNYDLDSNAMFIRSNGIYSTVFHQILKENEGFFAEPANIAPLLQAYHHDLRRILLSAPRLTGPLTVYRGFQSESHLEGLEYNNPDFVSTSLRIKSALSFAKFGPSFYQDKHVKEKVFGGVYEITIDETIPCVYLELNTLIPHEYEVLLPPGLHFKFDSKIYYKKYVSNKTFNTGKRIAIVHAQVERHSLEPAIPYVPRILVGGTRRRHRVHR